MTHVCSMQLSELTRIKQTCSKNNQTNQSIRGHQWPNIPRRRFISNDCSFGDLFGTLYMKYSNRFISRNRNIQYSNEITNKQKHHVIVVKAENCLVYCKWAQMKGSAGKTMSVYYFICARHAFAIIVTADVATLPYLCWYEHGANRNEYINIV